MHLIYIFDIDDGISTDFSAREYWKATQRVYQLIGYLGIQDVCRKKTTPSQRYCYGICVGKEVEENEVDDHSYNKGARRKGGFNFKDLKKECGYLVYIFRTYRSIVSYVKDIHQTLDLWKS